VSGAAARRGATGTIANLTANSLTIHDTRCNTDVKVTFDQSVIVRKTVVGQASDLQESETITVTGTRQADGSIKANSINIVPAGSGGFGGFGGGAANGG
jgi:predicted secreted protein